VSVLLGLSAIEVAFVEAALTDISLPSNLRELLALGVPFDDDFPDYCSPTGLRLLRFAV
jgi:hypothetical protein